MAQPLPRFANPHLRPQPFERATRAEIYAEEAQRDGVESAKADNAAVEKLNRLIEASLPANFDSLSSPTPARDKVPETMEVDHDQCEEQAEELVLFRLVSSASPIPLSLRPPPPPPSKTREPDAEDTEERALLRKQFAEAASIEGKQVLRDSKKLKASSRAQNEPSVTLTASIGKRKPSVLILRTLQPPRKTRPPVPTSLTLHYPYVGDASQLPAQPSTSKIPGCLTVDAHPTLPKEPKRRSRRRREAQGVQKERPPPQFWRPSPDMKGKCREYAYGYPSNLPTDYLGVWKYRRDTMKKATFSDSSVGSHFQYT